MGSKIHSLEVPVDPENKKFSEKTLLTACFALIGFVLFVMVLFVGALAGFFRVLKDHGREIGQLHQTIQKLEAANAMRPPEDGEGSPLLDGDRSAICFISGIYRVTLPGKERPSLRAHFSGSGFIAEYRGFIATNRHVAEPWFGDSDAQLLIRLGGVPKLERMAAYFPGRKGPVDITPVAASSQVDLAVVRYDASAVDAAPIRLEEKAFLGERVVVFGYPMGSTLLVAKSPADVYERLAYRSTTDETILQDLSANLLIRPTRTMGHVSDILEDGKLVYDAPTQHGASGSPVLNDRGRAIGVNAAFVDGFSGGALGVSSGMLKPLLDAARAHVAAE